ncbi:MAG: CDP-diacylglycerol--glycerol-3-phosphate 3-phosphatidyltransferase [Pseudobutyrivibrio sp.]|nr:CDP-diacylglycerol--glycerol-3-phosphate 3-phosphatidyltransferase [Pseudobutyrivibrio sp.]
MNLPNKLTLFRVVLIPFFVFFLLINPESIALRIVADLIFIVASLTDMLDGKIARKYNLVTNFGKFMDPLADKLLVCSAMICLISTGQLSAVFVIIIVAREFIISGFRLIAAENGIVIAANIFGKLKTVSQMVMIIILVANLPFAWLQFVGQVFVWLSLILTVLSLVIYIYQNSDVLKEQK